MADSPVKEGLVTPGRLLAFVLYLLLLPALLFLIAGRLDWWQAWAYVGLTLPVTVYSRWAAYRKHPDLLLERARYREVEGVLSGDRALASALGLYGPLAVLAVSALEVRFRGLPDGYWVLCAAAGPVTLLGLALATWAFLENRFFSAVVRIQVERGHTVCDSGPYRWIRHPGYAGGLIAYLAIPWFLGTPWALAPSLLWAVAAVVRTSREDRFLSSRLAGYAEYQARVRYRLVPGLW